jgi:predicted DNA repair protein MutK
LPVAIIPVLLPGGAYLAYKGAEKIIEYLFHRKVLKAKTRVTELSDEEARDYENKKIKSAILVDFILSAEIVIIALGTVLEEPLFMQIVVVSVVALLATVGVYGRVALLVGILAVTTVSLVKKLG